MVNCSTTELVQQKIQTLTVKQSVWRNHTTDPKTASSAKPVPVIEPLRELLAELGEEEGNPTSGPILRGVKGKPLSLDMLTSVTIRPALHNRANYRDGEAKNWKPLETRIRERRLEWIGLGTRRPCASARVCLKKEREIQELKKDAKKLLTTAGLVRNTTSRLAMSNITTFGLPSCETIHL
jgi:hypothetical protein